MKQIISYLGYSADTKGWSNAGLMLGHRRQRWLNIKLAFSQQLVTPG